MLSLASQFEPLFPLPNDGRRSPWLACGVADQGSQVALLMGHEIDGLADCSLANQAPESPFLRHRLLLDQPILQVTMFIAPQATS